MDFLALRRRILSLLAKEIAGYLPQFEPNSSDYQMMIYALRDLETWLKNKWALKNRKQVFEKINYHSEHDPEEFRSFLTYWTGFWLMKWNQRVRVHSEKVILPPKIEETMRKTKNLYKSMEYKKDLMQMVIQKLVRNNEPCLTKVFAENLVIEEIFKRLAYNNNPTNKPLIDPFNIFISVCHRISKLSKEKGPQIFLRVKS